MSEAFVFAEDILTDEDVASLRELVALLGDRRRQIAATWSERLMTRLPEYFPADGAWLPALTDINAGVLGLVFEHLTQGDATGLYAAYYQHSLQIIQGDLERAPAQRISLGSLYTSARISMQVIAEHLQAQPARLLLAYTKLTAQLMMIACQAYSDAREAYLQRAFEQINTLSHELRTPLASLFAYLEMLRAGDYGPVSAKQESVLSQLIHDSDDLLWLLASTLDLSRLDTGRVSVHLEPVQLDTLLAEVLRTTPHVHAPVTCTVAPDLPAVYTDRIKLKQILSNLLRNAVRYGANRPVTLCAERRRADLVELSVRDEGPGIEPGDLRLIFEFFERGHGAALARDGYGIGLHVVRRLAALLGGTVAVDSVPGQGSCFRVTLPLQQPAAPAPP